MWYNKDKGGKIMGSIATYIADKAAKKKQSPAEWIQSNLPNLERCRAVSHIARIPIRMLQSAYTMTVSLLVKDI